MGDSSLEPANDIEQVQLGALDLGSNSFHLIIAQESQGRIQVLDKHKEMVRLAAGLNADNQLSRGAQDRALDCLTRFAQRLRPLDGQNVRVVGTNTLRKARSKSFLKEAENILGHKIDIISGREEARLIYLGVCHDLGASESNRLIVDIGGGSTELVVGQKFKARVLESLFMGCVSMTEKFFKNGKISTAAFQRAIDHAWVELEPVTQAFVKAGWETAIGTSGTIGAVADVIAKNFDSSTITLAHLNELKDQLCQFKRVDDIAIDGLNEDRRPVFVGGVAILLAVFQALEIQEMSPSSSALREGLIFDLIGRQHQDDARESTVRNVMQRFNVDMTQARAVHKTASSLLKQVEQAWQLEGEHAQHLLAWAASLIEIGMDIAHSGYHKHSAYLVENMDMPGFSSTDQRQIALLVRCHRRKLQPSLFSDDDQSMPRLVSLLRLAAMLHRNRSQDELPPVGLTANDTTLTMHLPKKWLKHHPLTLLDLKEEAEYLTPLGLTLELDTG